jgi:phosphatidate cytidylyltransferase
MAARDGSTREVAPPRWVATELGTRVISALVLGIVTLLVTYAGGWPFSLFWLVAGFAVLLEWTRITRVEPPRSLQAATGLGLAALTILYLTQSPPWTLLAVGALVLVAVAALGRTRRDRTWAFAGFAYAAVLVLVPPAVRDDASLGLVGILWMFAVVWATDIAAYFSGRSLGGPKLWPRVSPKKTWSGFFGGLLGGTLSGMLVVAAAERLGWSPLANMFVVLVVSAAASLASQLGDLGESFLKRRFDVKDSSHLIPGHGGVMDRVDGFWAVAAGCGAVIVAAELVGGIP